MQICCHISIPGNLSFHWHNTILYASWAPRAAAPVTHGQVRHLGTTRPPPTDWSHMSAGHNSVHLHSSYMTDKFCHRTDISNLSANHIQRLFRNSKYVRSYHVSTYCFVSLLFQMQIKKSRQSILFGSVRFGPFNRFCDFTGAHRITRIICESVTCTCILFCVCCRQTF